MVLGLTVSTSHPLLYNSVVLNDAVHSLARTIYDGSCTCGHFFYYR